MAARPYQSCALTDYFLFLMHPDGFRTIGMSLP